MASRSSRCSLMCLLIQQAIIAQLRHVIDVLTCSLAQETPNIVPLFSCSMFRILEHFILQEFKVFREYHRRICFYCPAKLLLSAPGLTIFNNLLTCSCRHHQRLEKSRIKRCPIKYCSLTTYIDAQPLAASHNHFLESCRPIYC